MTSMLSWVSLAFAMIVAPALSQSGSTTATWLDQPKPASWNRPGASIPAAPKVQETVDQRCREQARPPQLDEDMRVHEQGWDLVGAFQGGWQMLVIRGTASYDGMCRPRQYQDFVFANGTFAGTLSPQPMDSRADGSLIRTSLQGPSRLAAEYARYGENDPLCCPTGTTTVLFEIPNGSPSVQLISSSTTKR